MNGPLASLILLASLAVAPTVGFAEDLPTYHLHIVAGQPVTFDFSDGRQAMLKVSHPQERVQIPFVISDNSCSNRQNMTCQYNFTYRLDLYQVVWISHPDASKLGQVVRRYYRGQPAETADPVWTTFNNTGLDPKTALTLNLPPHEIECADFSWLPGAGAAAPASLHLTRWDGEDLATNRDTGAQENRTVRGAVGIDLNRSDANHMSVKNILGINSDRATVQLLAYMPTESLIVKKADGDSCQVGLTSTAFNLVE